MICLSLDQYSPNEKADTTLVDTVHFHNIL